MIKDKIGVIGKMSYIQRDGDGNIKQMGVNHNIVTNEGDALIADLVADSPARTKVDNTNGNMTVGTGWTGTSTKTNTAVNAIASGSPTKGMEATYPKLKGIFGNADDNVVQYRSFFTAGLITGTPTLNEVGLGNNAVEGSGDNLAYSELIPNVPMAPTDTLQINWELTFLGA